MTTPINLNDIIKIKQVGGLFLDDKIIFIYHDTIKYQTAVKIAENFKLCGISGWKIPKIEELRVIVPKLHNIKNIKLTPHRFWSSTTSSWHNNCYISLDYDYLSEHLLNKETNVSGVMGICEIKGENS